MKKAQRALPIGIVLLTMLLITACDSINCPMNNMVYTVYGLTNADGTADTLTDTLSIITMRRVPDTEPVVVNREIGVSSVKVPISYEHPEDVFLFLFYKGDTTVVDTVVVNKSDRMHFESVDCNPSYFHTIKGVTTTHNLIDSIVVNNPEVNYDATNEHFHLYIRHLP